MLRKYFILLALLIVVVAAIIVFSAKSNKLVVDRPEVERLATFLLSGAKPPKGLQGAVFFHLDDMRVAVFAPSLLKVEPKNMVAGDMRIVIANPNGGNLQPPAPDEIFAKIGKAREQAVEATDQLEEKPTVLTVGGHGYPAQEARLVLKGGTTRLLQFLTVIPVKNRPVVVLITGPEDGFPTATRDEFLAGLSVGAPATPSAPLPPGPPAR